MAKDIIHNAIRVALENDGWEITKDPFTLNLMGDDTFVHIDMSAQKSAKNKSKDEKSLLLKSSRLRAFLC
jgi:hypothetical protein